MAKNIAYFIFLFFTTTLLNVTLATPVDTSLKHYECDDECYWNPQHDGYAPCYPNCGCYNSV
ncbi:3560_t:CDS:1, partial [Gigaspora rosea]